MRIKDVQIDGFGVWSGLTVHSMPDTMTVFYGPNEAGKTTLMHFLRTMFYGFTEQRRTRYLPPVYAGKPGGAIRVTGPGGGYEICRRAQLDQGAGGGQLTVTGSDGLSQGQHRLAMLLGQVDESIFTNVFAIGLRELQELSTLDDTAAADELYKLSSGLDRVSLVDVTRQLKAARQQIVGASPDGGQLQRLMLQREKLRDEIDHLTSQGRRWSELAALRHTQNSELEELKQRIALWEIESRTYEVAIQVRPTWAKRAEVEQKCLALGARTDLMDTSADRLADISKQIAERASKVAELRQQRRSLREQARNLPLRRGILELAAKIEAASEQAPWIGSLQKNIQRLETQISQTREQLVEDAKRLGITDEDQQALLDDRRLARMPDLSRQAINQLAEPASEVRLWSTRLKQAKQQSEVDKKEVDRLAKELSQAMENRSHADIHTAMNSNGEMIAQLRKRMQVQEALDKQIARREQLEEEAVDLAVDEALPVERSFLMGILFVGGAFLLLWGMGKSLPFFQTEIEPDSQTGILFIVIGLFMLFFGAMWSSVLDRSTVSSLEDVEDQIEAIRKEIRKTEMERDEFDRRLPAHSGPLEVRLREAENEISALEGLLPVQHNRQAASERFAAARKRAVQAAESLRIARNQWQKTLSSLGLTESLSPKSIRIMAEGYDSLLQTRRRMQSLEEELETRQLELGALTQRVDSLARQAFAAKAASEVISGVSNNSIDEDDEFEDEIGSRAEMKMKARHNLQQPAKVEPIRAGVETATRALEQLAKLTALISSQEQFILQKRSMREQDQTLSKQAAGLQKSIDKLHRTHSAYLAELGCESEEQLLQLLEIKQLHQKLTAQAAEFSERVLAVISGTVPYETIARLLDTPGSEDLEKRWEQISQRTQQAEKRVEQLHQRQGELGQEMKSLASNSRLSEAKLEWTCVENQLKACAEHWQTLAVTTLLLDSVCEVYETERQPETLREASAFLNQLTEGKYVRIWTPLGKNQLRIDNATGQALPLEVLSRGTREAVFIALRLSLAAAYARRGVTIPLVLDDVLVNFDSARAESAAKVLRDFAALGHQVIMFTCHEHIMRIFDNIDVQVRVLPHQGQPGEAEIYFPDQPEPRHIPAPEPYLASEELDGEELDGEELDGEEIHAEETDDDPIEVYEPVAEEIAHDQVAEEVGKEMQSTSPEPVVMQSRLPERKPRAQVRRVVVVDQPEIDWLWYERTPDKLEWGWVDSAQHVNEEDPPNDLWWNRGRTAPAPAASRAEH